MVNGFARTAELVCSFTRLVAFVLNRSWRCWTGRWGITTCFKGFVTLVVPI